MRQSCQVRTELELLVVSQVLDDNCMKEMGKHERTRRNVLAMIE
jgi:hypothetical protein